MAFLRRFAPDAVCASVWDVDFDALRKRGVDTLFFDVDNTLLPYNHTETSEPLRALFRSLAERGFTALLISNNHPPRIRPTADALGVAFVANARKPTQRGYKRAMRQLSREPRQCAMIGDQLLTDIIGARRAGIHCILVNPIDRREMALTRMNRLLERGALRLMRVRRPRKSKGERAP